MSIHARHTQTTWPPKPRVSLGKTPVTLNVRIDCLLQGSDNLAGFEGKCLCGENTLLETLALAGGFKGSTLPITCDWYCECGILYCLPWHSDTRKWKRNPVPTCPSWAQAVNCIAGVSQSVLALSQTLFNMVSFRSRSSLGCGWPVQGDINMTGQPIISLLIQLSFFDPTLCNECVGMKHNPYTDPDSLREVPATLTPPRVFMMKGSVEGTNMKSCSTTVRMTSIC